ncbi:NAD(P)H-hydrate dehydratase [Cellulomonas denverensis]|uniref:ADP-dependent (S)-NAD(P)H-hydrate dehydratase n=1 Tax=Cellulomonas denverensis TaxID=264297 RepID=A0A7X6KUW5_9CELL|nr:NAD(P)H-hydrate dehydratase [Cellulomonas denverensis]NKY22453.1 NAD(P)H-hydrate dehydratase [Cellulomonas denverensis]GIG25926.1 ADP-dependent (S)-NAD(P)H-hydrate dehydratase [Cellulomonas denverensis]
MTTPAPLTPAALRDWPLPDRSGSKDDRGGVLVIGGARPTPGAVLLAGYAALRVGAGRLTLAVAESVAPSCAAQFPEAGALALPERPDGSPTGAAAPGMDREIARADAVIVGPGLDEPEGAAALLSTVLADADGTAVLIDAFALGVLPGLGVTLPAGTVLTPNLTEAARLLERDDVDPELAAGQLAARYGAVVSCAGLIAHPDGRLWATASGHPGLGTSGSGDVLSGAIGGLLAGGCPPEQAASWGTALHATAGDRLAARIGPLGFLARELTEEFPGLLVEFGA